jgi:hypothetical protein
MSDKDISIIMINDTSDEGFDDLMEQMASPIVITQMTSTALCQLDFVPEIAEKFGKTENQVIAALLVAIAKRAF